MHEGATDHWPTPSRALEADLSEAVYKRYVTCTASAEPDALCTAYHESWKWSLELFENIAGPMNIELPEIVMAQVQKLLDEAVTHCNVG